MMGSRAFPRSCARFWSFAAASRAPRPHPVRGSCGTRASGACVSERVREPLEGAEAAIRRRRNRTARWAITACVGQGHDELELCTSVAIDLSAESPAPHVRIGRRLHRWSSRVQARSGRTRRLLRELLGGFAPPCSSAGAYHRTLVQWSPPCSMTRRRCSYWWGKTIAALQWPVSGAPRGSLRVSALAGTPRASTSRSSSALLRTWAQMGSVNGGNEVRHHPSDPRRVRPPSTTRGHPGAHPGPLEPRYDLIPEIS